MPTPVSSGQYTIVDQADPVNASLSNSSFVVATDSNGGSGNYAGCVTTMSILLGSVDVSADWTVTASASSGVTGALSGKTYTVTNLTADSGYVDLTASAQGFVSVTKRFSLSKSKTGAQGPAVSVTAGRAATFTATDGTLDASQADIVFTAAVSGVSSPTYVWTFSGLQTNPTASTSSTQTITAAQFGTSKSATVTCTVSGTYADTVTIVRLEKSSAAAGATYTPPALPDTNLYLHSKGNLASAPDLGPNKLTQTITGTITGSTGPTGTSLVFGSGEVKYPADSYFDGNPIFSVSGMFYRTGDVSGDGPWGIGGGTSVAAISGYAHSSRTNKISIDLWGTATFDAGIDYPLNTWVHVVWVKRAGDFSTTNVSIWVNGVEYTGASLYINRGSTHTPSLNATAQGITVGNIWSGDAQYRVQMRISELRIYKEALTKAGVEYLRQFPAGNAPTATDTKQLLDGAGLGTTATWSSVSGTGKPADNANNTSIDANGLIQGVSSGAGTAVKNANITITEDGKLSGAGAGQVSLTSIPGTLQTTHLKALTMAADSSITAGTATDGLTMDANTKSLKVMVGGSERVRIGDQGSSVNGATFGMVAKDTSGNVIFDSRNNVGIVGNQEYDNFNVGDSTTNPDWNGGANGVGNIAIGANALRSDGLAKNPDRHGNVAVGFDSLRYNTGYGNIGVGYSSMRGSAGARSMGYANIAIGFGAMMGLTTGNKNIAIGNNAATSVSTGGCNTLIGSGSGASVTTGSNNTFLGNSSGNGIADGSGNTLIGYMAGANVGFYENTTIIASGAGELLKHDGTSWSTTSDFNVDGVMTQLGNSVLNTANYSSYAIPRTEGRNFGGIYVNPNAGDAACTTAQFISHLDSLGMFGYPHATAKVYWNYAGNNNISDTGFGELELAGSVIETWTQGTYKHVRVTRPTTGAGGFQTLVYNNQGSGYSPGWRAYITSENIGSFAPTLTDTGAVSATNGIKFPATQSASADANHLDDYEEGTFTPTIIGVTAAGAGTYTSQVGRYTKIGNRVFYHIRLTWTAHTGTGFMRISGLPFTVSASGSLCPGAVVYSGLSAGASKQVACYPIASTSTLYITAVDPNGGTNAEIPIDTAVSYFAVSGHYEV